MVCFNMALKRAMTDYVTFGCLLHEHFLFFALGHRLIKLARERTGGVAAT
jgi:hypothetical protein